MKIVNVLLNPLPMSNKANNRLNSEGFGAQRKSLPVKSNVMPVEFMSYDLKEIQTRCAELGISNELELPQRLSVFVGGGVVLVFENSEEEEDCLVGFNGTPWHTHDEFMFVGQEGRYVELDSLGLISGLADGSVLICELWKESALTDRWLIHRDFNNEYKYMEVGEEIRVWRALRMQ